MGTAANCSLLGYDHKAFVGINVDAAAVPDVGMLAGCIREGFDAVIALGDVSEHKELRKWALRHQEQI